MTLAPVRRALSCCTLVLVLLGSAYNPARASTPATSHRAVYAGFEDGTIYVSIDQGLSWMAAGTVHLADSSEPFDLAVDGGAGSVLYAGTYGGVYRSADAGRHWSLALRTEAWSVVASAPGTPGLAYAVLSPANYGRSTLARTTDAGAHWSRALLPVTNDQFEAPTSIAVDPGRPTTLALQGRRGTLVSDDGGQTWRKLLSFDTLVWDPSDPNVAYAVNNSLTPVRTNDRGAHWQPTRFTGPVTSLFTAVPGHAIALLGKGSEPTYLYRAEQSHQAWQVVLQDTIGVLAADPLTPGLILASGTTALYRSGDGGTHWASARTPFSPYMHNNLILGPLGVVALAFGPRPVSAADPLPEDAARSTAPAGMSVSGTVYTGIADGAQAGVSQEISTAPLIPCGALATADSATALAVDPRNVSTIYAGTTKNLSVSTDTCRHWNLVADVPAGSVSALAIDPSAGTVYAALLPNHIWSSTGDGAHWRQHAVPRSTKITSLAILPGAPAIVFAGTLNGIFATTDGGATWRDAAPQLHNGGVNALAVDPTAAGALWAVGANGVFHTDDAGKSWRTSQLPATTDNTFGTQSNAVPSHPLQGYTTVAENSRGTVLVGDAHNDIFRSSDRGHTWTKEADGADTGACRDGCPNGSALVFDPAIPEHALSFATDGGYNSADEGLTWVTYRGIGGEGFVDAVAATPRSPLPVDPTAPPVAALPGTRYVAATRHSIGAPFLSFYDKNGGLRLFGLPLTEAYAENGQTVQVFERARLTAGSGGVAISPLGYWLTAGQAFPTTSAALTAPRDRYFARTHQALAGRFVTFYQTHQGDVLLGSPISPLVQVHAADGSGSVYQAQWFENGRLEYHPELRGTPYEISIGLAGKEFLRQRDWL